MNRSQEVRLGEGFFIMAVIIMVCCNSLVVVIFGGVQPSMGPRVSFTNEVVWRPFVILLIDRCALSCAVWRGCSAGR